MKRFATLIEDLDQTTKSSKKISLLAHYLRTAPQEDRLWCIALFSGRRPRRAISSGVLREWAAAQSGLPLWLLEESYHRVGDLAETLSLLLPDANCQDNASLAQWCQRISALNTYSLEEKQKHILAAWQSLEGQERFVFHKLLTGGFRIGVSQKLMLKALAIATQQPAPELAHRLMGNWTPQNTDWHMLIEAPLAHGEDLRPYPFCLANALDVPPDQLGKPNDWIAEWKWDGIRGQILNRSAGPALWSRGEELLTPRFPEFFPLYQALPKGTVLDGEILAWGENAPKSFAALQPRIARKSVPKKLLQEAPARFLAYDLLELQGKDLRQTPLSARRDQLASLIAKLSPDLPIGLSQAIEFDDWQRLSKIKDTARDVRAEGLMLKKAQSPYGIGRQKGSWWKWKLAPLRIDAVMIYAQAGHGRRANLFTDFTFALWDNGTLVPIAKAYSGLSDKEFGEISRWVRKNTQNRFGPVRQVTPDLVFELAFEGLQVSKRHKSGVALRFVRMKRWHRDKAAAQASHLSELLDLLAAYG